MVLACNNKQTSNENSQAEINAVPEKIFYGIGIDTLILDSSVVKRGQTLGGLLAKQGCSAALAQEAIDMLQHAGFKLKHIKPGHKFWWLKDPTNGKLKYFVYDDGVFEYATIFLGTEKPIVNFVKRPITVKEIKIALTIQSSLYQTIQDAEVHSDLAPALAGIYDWTIDFFNIKKGDYFKVIFDEKYVNGKPVGISNIKAAFFFHNGKEFYAIPFDVNGKRAFYNEKGESMRKRYLKAPLDYSRISSHFSMRRIHPVLGTARAHLGIDYAAPTGTPIRTVGDGVVLEATKKGGNGIYVKVQHNKQHATQYLHMSKIANGVKAGVRVSQGQVIGYVGATGLATGPHLCFRFWENGKQVNPLTVITPPSEPLPKQRLDAYLAYANPLIDALNKLQNNVE